MNASFVILSAAKNLASVGAKTAGLLDPFASLRVTIR